MPAGCARRVSPSTPHATRRTSYDLHRQRDLLHSPRRGRQHRPASRVSQVCGLQPLVGTSQRFVVVTGGEPLLQLDAALIAALHGLGFEIAVETNGTLAAPAGLDWICMSPKAGTVIRQRSGNEVKLVYPQPGISQEDLERLDFDHFFLQPMDGPDVEQNTVLAARYCLEHPRWRLSLQTHKLLGIR